MTFARTFFRTTATTSDYRDGRAGKGTSESRGGEPAAPPASGPRNRQRSSSTRSYDISCKLTSSRAQSSASRYSARPMSSRRATRLGGANCAKTQKCGRKRLPTLTRAASTAHTVCPSDIRERPLAPDLCHHLREFQRLLRRSRRSKPTGRRGRRAPCVRMSSAVLTIGGSPRPFDPPFSCRAGGLTFFTPLQERHRGRAQAGRRVHLVFAYRPEHPRAFRRLHEPYEQWWGGGPNVIGEHADGEGALVALRQPTLRGRSGRGGCSRT